MDINLLLVSIYNIFIHIMDERELERILDEAFRNVIQTNFPQAGTVLTRMGEQLSRNDSTNSENTNQEEQNDISYSEVPIQASQYNEDQSTETMQNTQTAQTTQTQTNTTTNPITVEQNSNHANFTDTNIPNQLPNQLPNQPPNQLPNTHILDITHNLFTNYHENMRLYQHNLSLMFRHLQALSRNALGGSSNTSSNNSARTRPRNRTSGLFSGLQDNLSLEIQSFPFYGVFPTGNGEPSHSIPTIQQFTNATEICTYTHNTIGGISRTCPITLEDFQEHEQIHKIKQCGHFFKSIPLQNWFSRNSHCPVCRYDIRTYNQNEQSQQPRSSFARQDSRSNSM